jgi:hypothetical protein
MGDAYDDGWEHAEANSLGCWQHAIEAIRRKKVTDPYQEFLAKKSVKVAARGLKSAPAMPAHLKPFQASCTAFALEVGTSGLFLDTGLGKTRCQLHYCDVARQEGNGKALILTPLAVARQIEREGRALGYDCRVIRDQSEAKDGINICNYDRLDKLDASAFSAISLDEASILKSFTGKTTRALIERFAGQRFKLVATATPAPNDHMEIGNYGEFLEIMAANEMLSRFFINDTSTASQHWRLKGHAENAFWDWMASWARMAELPSDLGDSDEGYILPPLNIHRHKAADSNIKADTELADMFGAVSLSATNLHDVKRQTADARAETVARLIEREPDESWVIWCDTDYEADALGKVIDAIEVRGSQSIDAKEDNLEKFTSGEKKRIIAKPSMCGHGLNWQHSARMAFVGRSYSYETYYQAVRREWRYGQKRPVDVHIVVAEGEGEIGRVIDRKANDHVNMKRAMREAMARANTKSTATKVAYDPKHNGRLPTWLMEQVVR